MKDKKPSDSARKPLVHSTPESDDSDTDWQDRVGESAEVPQEGFFSGLVKGVRKSLKHGPPTRVNARQRCAKISQFFSSLSFWKMSRMTLYLLLLSFILLGTVVCFGVHISHNKYKALSKRSRHSQSAHGHRYIKGHCEACAGDEDETPALVILQANDIYELGPYIYETDGSEKSPDALAETGGLSKFLALKKSYQAKHGKTKVIAALSGDYLSPSAMSTAKIRERDIGSLQEKHSERNGKRTFAAKRYFGKTEGSLAGAHMISVGNKVFDVATFGNHEFDLSEKDLKSRVTESWFPWIASNLSIQGNFTKNVIKYRITETLVHAQSDSEKPKTEKIRFGFISATMNSFSVPSYVKIMNSTQTKTELIRLTKFLRVEKGVNFVVLLTHLSLASDISLIKAFSEDETLKCEGINLVLGGHEHESSYGVIGNCAVPLTKSFYNAKAVYVHKIFRDKHPKETPTFHVDSVFVPLENDCPEDETLNTEITEWWALAADAFVKEGLDLKKSVAYLSQRYDLRNDLIYTERNPLLVHIADAHVHCSGSSEVDGGIFNTGAIRVDNFIGPGVFSVYDVVRVWPYEDPIKIVRISGATLRKIIETSNLVNRGTHGFIQLSAEFSDGCMSIEKPSQFDDMCTLQGKPILSEGSYRIALPGYLLEGKQENLEFLEDCVVEGEESDKLIENDVRHCLASYLPIHFPLQG